MAKTGAGYDIQIKSLYKIFGPRAAECVNHVQHGMTKTELNQQHGHILGLRDINITMRAGCVQVIMGLSGSGKSTLIRHINRLIEPTAGQILVDGKDVVKMDLRALREFRRLKTAMVFQKFALLPHRTVLENTAYGLQIQRKAESECKQRAMFWIERVGLKGFEHHYPNQLSGGMQQRVGLARALTNDAPILLMDEAYSALDPLIRVDMQDVLLDLQKELQKTIVFITHDLDEALRLGDQIAILRDGEVIQQGTGQHIVMSPANDYIQRFVKEVNRGRVLRVESILGSSANDASVTSISVNTGTTLDEAAALLAKTGERMLRVVNGKGESLGTLSMDDIIRHTICVPASDATSRWTSHENGLVQSYSGLAAD